MEKSQRIAAIIPARGGSKSIPRKNIRSLGGFPLIAYSIAAAKHSRYIDRIIVSTDDKAIADIAKAWGAEVPFFRPEALSGDSVTDFPVFEHAVQWLDLNDHYRADVIVQLRPTSPFRPPGLVDEAIETLLRRPDASSVRTVAPSGENPYKMWRIVEDTLTPLLQTSFDEPYNMPRQALPETYWQTGHIDVIRYETIIGLRSLTGEVIVPCLVPHEYAIDLDNLRQWEYAEFLLEKGELDIVMPQYVETEADALLPDSPDWATKLFKMP